MSQKIRTALISVSDKTGIIEFAGFLSAMNIQILSTGGTAKILRESGIEVKDVSELTGFPEMMDGRVKTLHPKVHGGLLGRRDVPSHTQAMEEHDITPIDMVVINLYPFEETVASGADNAVCVENIDIGGPSMIRSAAKNYNDVTVITDTSHYVDISEEIKENDGSTTLETRRYLAEEAFSRTASYDTAISSWFMSGEKKIFPKKLNLSYVRKDVLRYGENPHQQAAIYVDGSSITSVANSTQIQGKELSYNNISDTDAAYDLVSEFSEQPTVAIIKHANPCGIACADTLATAYEKAFSCDPVSAFGGIFAFNRKVGADIAELMSKVFAEVIIAPDMDEDAKELFAKKKNLRVLLTGELPDPERKAMLVKSIAGGLLLQTRDNETLDENELKIVTKREPTEQELKDLLFAFKVCKHVKSNAIVFAKDGATVGVGAGQMSRIDSSRIGSHKAKETATSVKNASGSVLASDAFFPFSDGLISAAESGITAVIQPGGSIRDDEVIKAADEHNIAMVLTGIRHFRH